MCVYYHHHHRHCCCLVCLDSWPSFSYWYHLRKHSKPKTQKTKPNQTKQINAWSLLWILFFRFLEFFLFCCCCCWLSVGYIVMWEQSIWNDHFFLIIIKDRNFSQFFCHCSFDHHLIINISWRELNRKNFPDRNDRIERKCNVCLFVCGFSLPFFPLKSDDKLWIFQQQQQNRQATRKAEEKY